MQYKSSAALLVAGDRHEGLALERGVLHGEDAGGQGEKDCELHSLCWKSSCLCVGRNKTDDEKGFLRG